MQTRPTIKLNTQELGKEVEHAFPLDGKAYSLKWRISIHKYVCLILHYTHNSMPIGNP